MEFTTKYVISQIFTIIMYALLALTYYAKDRKNILIINFLAVSANVIAYAFLNAWSGLAMCFISLTRNIIFLVDENKNGKRETINKKDIIILITLYVISIVLAVFTYEGILSLFCVFATMLYTFSIWQKNTKVYKFLGILVELLWLIYNIYICSIFAIFLEGILLICCIIGYILEVRKNKKIPENK